jgi:lipoate-protein ligase A
MFLHVLRSCEEAGIEVTRREVDGGAVFWPHYYSGLADDDHALIPYQPHELLKRQAPD